MWSEHAELLAFGVSEDLSSEDLSGDVAVPDVHGDSPHLEKGELALPGADKHAPLPAADGSTVTSPSTFWPVKSRSTPSSETR